jgi:hypothetical protein
MSFRGFERRAALDALHEVRSHRAKCNTSRMDPSIAPAIKSLLATAAHRLARHVARRRAASSPWCPSRLLPRGPDFVIHVSALAAHTGDMLANPKVSLLVVAIESEGVPPQAVARITCRARRCAFPHEAAIYPEAREAYLRRFPTARRCSSSATSPCSPSARARAVRRRLRAGALAHGRRPRDDPRGLKIVPG